MRFHHACKRKPALSGLHLFALIAPARPYSAQMRIHPAQRWWHPTDMAPPPSYQSWFFVLANEKHAQDTGLAFHSKTEIHKIRDPVGCYLAAWPHLPYIGEMRAANELLRLTPPFNVLFFIRKYF